MSENLSFRPSGQVHLPGFGVALLAGVAACFVLGWAYNILINIIPIVYVNFLICMGLGVVISQIGLLLLPIAKIRSQKGVVLFFGLLAIAAFIFQWLAYFTFLLSGSFSFNIFRGGLALLTEGGFLWDMLREIYRYGTWQIFGVTFKDYGLLAVWGVEALIILVIPVLTAKRYQIPPFSEFLGRWYPAYVINYEFESISTQNEFRAKFKEDPLDALAGLTYGRSNRFSKVKVYFHPDESHQYVSVMNVFREDNGKGKEKMTPIVTNRQITTATARQIMEKFTTKKENFWWAMGR
jgi:hypothetical protein